MHPGPTISSWTRSPLGHDRPCRSGPEPGGRRQPPVCAGRVRGLRRLHHCGARSPRQPGGAGRPGEIIDETEGEFDIIYNDIDKDGYPEAFRKAIPRLRSGGLFITDNMLWGGRVITQEPGGAPEGLDERERWFHDATIGVREVTRLLYSSLDVFTTLIPLRDGVSVAVKR